MQNTISGRIYKFGDNVNSDIIIAGRYHDRFARDADGWYFVEREEHLDLVGDCSRHLKLAIDSAH